MRRFFIAATLFTLLSAACSSVTPPTDGSAASEKRGRTRRSESADLSPAQELERLREGTARICTPGHNTGAMLHGGGPYCLPFDAIPAIDESRFVRADGARFLPPAEPVIAVEIGADARAYPVRYLLRHEIVNDTVATEPIVVTYCPLCNSAAAFSSRVAGRALTFGVSGQLVNANLVMFDRETLSLWTQVEGRAFAGELERTRLRRLPVVMVSFGEPRGPSVADEATGQGSRRPIIDELIATGVPAVAAAGSERRGRRWLASLYVIIPLLAIATLMSLGGVPNSTQRAPVGSVAGRQSPSRGELAVSAQNISFDTNELRLQAGAETVIHFNEPGVLEHPPQR